MAVKRKMISFMAEEEDLQNLDELHAILKTDRSKLIRLMIAEGKAKYATPGYAGELMVVDSKTFHLVMRKIYGEVRKFLQDLETIAPAANDDERMDKMLRAIDRDRQIEESLEASRRRAKK